MKNIKTALVLSGGGARGIAHIGVIEALNQAGFEITSIAGTSMGAVVAGVYAMGKLEDFKKWMFTLDKLKVFNLVDFTFSSRGLVKGDKVLGKMKEFIHDKNIEDMNIPFVAVAVDLIEKSEVVFSKGSFYDAARASISIPTVITPVKKGKSLLVDGGIMNNIPVNHVKRNDGDVLIAVNVNANVEKVELPEETHVQQSIYREKMEEFQNHLKKIMPASKEDNLSFFDLVNQTIGLMTNRIAQLQLEKHRPDILIEVSRESCGFYDFYKAEELVQIGQKVARKSIDEYLGR